MKTSSEIVCKGAGTWHGYQHGRHWFMCSYCRWSSTRTRPVVLKGKKYVDLDPVTEANHKAFRDRMMKDLTA